MGIHIDFPTPAPPPLWNFDHDCLMTLLFLLLLLVPPVTAQLVNAPPPPPPDPFAKLRFDKTIAVVLVILVVVFFVLGFVSIYTRQCSERRIRGRLDLAVAIGDGIERRPPRGLDPAIIDTFPTFVYSEVKGLKIGRTVLECAVCITELRDDETLRLLPKCFHVFHPDCIDSWLVNHSTCPVCRANLVPKPDDVSSTVTVQIPDPGGPDPEQDHDCDSNSINPVDNDERNRIMTEPSSVNLEGQNHPVLSRSTGFGIHRLFPRSHSTGHSMVRPGEDCERFTLRLPEEVRNRLVNEATPSRTKSCGLVREKSGRKGYRTRSMGRNYPQYERFGGENRLDRWGLMWTPPFLCRAGSLRSMTKDGNMGMGVMGEVELGEGSSDHLFSKD